MMYEATLCFLVRGEPPRDVLLGLKKIGLGAGKYAGFGGKVEPGETVVGAAVRELAEEAGVSAVEAHLQPIGHLTFLFPTRPAWDQVVHVFLVEEWEGEPAESAEMQPQWFALDALPVAQMWQDSAHWLARVLAGQSIRARFTYADDCETVRNVAIEASAFARV
jgi:8-oxo-dGTP pyrophosphatase MutT (NUDIX family)